MNMERKLAVGRRQLLQLAGVAATATAAIPLAQQSLADTEANAEKRKARYRETDDVKAFYRVNRYPAAK
jgi:hypothetical protein